MKKDIFACSWNSVINEVNETVFGYGLIDTLAGLGNSVIGNCLSVKTDLGYIHNRDANFRLLHDRKCFLDDFVVLWSWAFRCGVFFLFSNCVLFPTYLKTGL